LVEPIHVVGWFSEQRIGQRGRKDRAQEIGDRKTPDDHKTEAPVPQTMYLTVHN
jgi:hypothetical protein